MSLPARRFSKSEHTYTATVLALTQGRTVVVYKSNVAHSFTPEDARTVESRNKIRQKLGLPPVKEPPRMDPIPQWLKDANQHSELHDEAARIMSNLKALGATPQECNAAYDEHIRNNLPKKRKSK